MDIFYRQGHISISMTLCPGEQYLTGQNLALHLRTLIVENSTIQHKL